MQKVQIGLRSQQKFYRNVNGAEKSVYEHFRNTAIFPNIMEAENKSKTESSKNFAQKEKIKERLSLRFNLQLTDSTDRSFPEFSYLELLGTNKNKKKDEDILHDGECNVDEIRALAKKFEDKYGPKSAAKKSKGHKIDRVQDLVDVTYGYDVTDSFVDDTEAYDELVPADWTTEHGGFYINMGDLNFRPLSSGDEKSDGDFKELKKKKTPKKKNKENKEKKLKDGKRCLSSSEKEKSSKKMRLNSDEKESKLQKLKKRINLDAGKLKTSKETPSDTVTQGNKPTKTLIENITLQSPVIKLEKNSITELRNSVSSNNSTSTPAENISTENENSLSVTLPDGLPPSLILSIQKLIEAARKAGGEAGKCKFFNSDVNRILLQIETDSRKLNCRARSAVYDYLALFLPCTKDTLLKRAKNLFMQEQVGRLREPLLKLRVAIEAAMPAQVKHYEEEVAKLSEEQALQSQKLCIDTVIQNGEKKDDVVMKDLEVDGENDKNEESTTPTDINAPTTPSEDKGKRAILPKRFVWKDDIRNLLCDVVGIKVELYLMSKSRSTTAEEALKGFLETEVRPLWPKGWMTTRILYRESKQAHVKVTSTIAVAKAKKDAKRPKEEESKTQDSNHQQVTAMVIDQKKGEGVKPANISTSTVSATSDVTKSTTVMKTSNAVRPEPLTTDNQTAKLKPSIQLKTEADIPVKISAEVNSQAKSQNESRVINPLQPGQPLGHSQMKLHNETQMKLQDPTQLNSQALTQVKHEDQNVRSESQVRAHEITPCEPLIVRTALQGTLQCQGVEKPSMTAATQGKPQVEHSEQKDRKSPDQLNLKQLSQSQSQSIHGQNPNQSLSSSHPQDHSLLKSQIAFQNQVKDRVKPRLEDDKSTLRKLLGPPEAQKDQPNIQLQSHLQKQNLVQKANAQLQGQSALHGQRSTIQNSQNNPHVPSHVQPITQQTGQGKGRGQILPQGQLKTSAYRQNQLESQNRIQNQLQALTHAQGQARGQSQLQSQFHTPSPREDQGHSLSQVQAKSPSSPCVAVRTNSPQRLLQTAFNSQTNINKLKAPGKTILDFLDEVNTSRNSQAFHSPENRPLSHATTVSSSLSSCSFQNVSQEHQISPPRNIKTPNSMAVQSPPLSSPNRHPIRNVSPIRQMSNNTGTFGNISPPKRLSSCSLQNIPSKLNQETPASPRSPRQGYNYINNVPSSPNLSCQFPMQPTRSSPESHQRTPHLNTLASTFMALSSSDKPKSQLTATSLLNSLANMSQNHITPNLPLVGQSSNPLQNNGVSMSSNPLTIPSMMNLQNVSNNKPQPGSGFPGNMKTFGGMSRPQFPNQQSMLRNNLPTELNDGNNRIPNFQPAYRPFS